MGSAECVRACVLGRGVVEAGREAGQGKKEQGCKYNELERNDVKSKPPDEPHSSGRGPGAFGGSPMYALSFPGQEIKASTVGTSKAFKVCGVGPKSPKDVGWGFSRGSGGEVLRYSQWKRKFFKHPSGPGRTGQGRTRAGRGPDGTDKPDGPDGRTQWTGRTAHTPPQPHTAPQPIPPLHPTPPTTAQHSASQHSTVQRVCVCVCQRTCL